MALLRSCGFWVSGFGVWGMFPQALASRAISGKAIESSPLGISSSHYVLRASRLAFNTVLLCPRARLELVRPLYQPEKSRNTSAHAEVHAGSDPQDLRGLRVWRFWGLESLVGTGFGFLGFFRVWGLGF